MDNAQLEQLEKQALAQAQGNLEVSDGTKLLLDRLHKLFDADDLVKIKNFTNHPIVWVYCNRKNTKIEQPDEYTRRVQQGEQKARSLASGASITIPGWEAYVALNRFYEDWAVNDKGDTRGSYVLSVNLQKEFLDKAYVGTFDINDLNSEPAVDVKKEVEDDLGLSDGKEAGQSSKAAKK